MKKGSFWHSSASVNVVAVAAVVALLGAILFPVLAETKGRRRDPCLSNIKQCDIALQLYGADHDDRLPPAGVWMDCASTYAASPEILACPDVRGVDPEGYGYAMNIALSANAISRVRRPEATAVLFDSVLLARNACSGFYGFPDPPRRLRNHVAFVDGHVGFLSPSIIADFGPDGVPKRSKPR